MKAIAPKFIDFWGTRSEGETYAYGTEPHAYCRQQFDALPPDLLLLTEEEGSNAVYATQHRW